MKPDEWPRLFITGAILLAFLAALYQHYGTGLEETLKNIVMLSVGYWLGSSKGSSDKDKALMTDGPAPVTVAPDATSVTVTPTEGEAK